MSDTDFVRITSPEDGLQSSWDKDAYVAFVRVTDEPLHHGWLNTDRDKVTEYDAYAGIIGFQIPYCPDVLTMKDIPERAEGTVKEVSKALVITVDP